MAKKKVFSIGTALAQGLEETIESAQNYSGELRVDVIPLKKIETDPENPRDLMITMEDIQLGLLASDPDYIKKSEELESLQSIAHSIQTQGIINPITVYKFGENYRLVAGERRTLASVLAGKTDIQAKILDSKPDELKISLLQWIENIERSDLSLWERIRNLEKIVAAHAAEKGVSASDITMTELSHLLGCSKPQAMHYRAVLKADGDLKKLIIENKIKNLEKAALIVDIQSPTARDSVIDACLNGATLKQMKALANQTYVKPTVIKPTETRGRQTTVINFGVTRNAHVAKVIIDSVLKNPISAHLAKQFEGVDWKNHRSVTESFKRLIKKLEELHT